MIGKMNKIIFEKEHQQILHDFMKKITDGAMHIENARYIGLIDENQNIIASLSVSDYRGNSVVIGFCLTGKITKSFIKFGCNYVFNQLKVKKALSFIDSTNEKSINFTQKLGSKLECTIKNACENDNDLLVFSMTKNQCKFLNN